MARPVSIVDEGGRPITHIADLDANQGVPLTPVDPPLYGEPVTVVDDDGGAPVVLVNEDFTIWSGFDTTAPILTSPLIDITISETTGSISITTDEGNGTIWWVVTQSATQPSVAQIEAGQDHTSSPADDNGSILVSAVDTYNAGPSGLTAATTYWAHAFHRDAASNDSAVVSGDSFTTLTAGAPTLSLPTDVQTGGTTATLTVTSDEANGVVYWVVTQSATQPTVAQIKAGQDHTGAAGDAFGNAAAESPAGVNTFLVTGLAEKVSYFGHFVHTDLELNDSNRVAGDGFTTPDVTPPALTFPIDTQTGQTTADLSVDTDDDDGTLYWVVTQAATKPSVAQIKLGQDHTGSAADDSGNQTVSATGTQNASATGLTAGTDYWAHFMHEDAATNQSTVATGDGFTTAILAMFIVPEGLMVDLQDGNMHVVPGIGLWINRS